MTYRDCPNQSGKSIDAIAPMLLIDTNALIGLVILKNQFEYNIYIMNSKTYFNNFLIIRNIGIN